MPASTILVVDSYRLVADTLVAILNSQAGEFIAVAAYDAKSAERLVQGIHPDLVLLAAVIVGTDTLELALSMRSKYGCKVLLISGAPEASAVLEEVTARGEEPFAILPKPVLPKELLNMMRQILTQ